MTADSVGGVWTYAMELCRVFSGRGIGVLLATMGDALSSEQRAQATSLPHVELAESEFKLEWMPNAWDDVDAAGHWLLELERRFRPDVIHLNSYAHGAYPFLAPKLVVAHSYVLSWWRAVKSEEAPPSWAHYAQRVREGLSQANLVVAPTASMLESVRRHYGPLSHAQVIHHGRDGGKFKSAAKGPFIFSAGRLWDEAKNLGVLSEIAPQLPWPVMVAGPRVRDGVGEFSSTNVAMLGELAESHLATFFARAAIGVFPARYEPFGLAVLEAALSECALVLGDIPSLRELWQGAAWFVPPDDAPALRHAILELVQDSARCAALGSRARQRALTMNPPAMGEAYLQAYSELMEKQAVVA